MFVTSKHQSNGSTCALLKLQDGEINHNKWQDIWATTQSEKKKKKAFNEITLSWIYTVTLQKSPWFPKQQNLDIQIGTA